MANVLLGATGSVAAVRIPALFEALNAAGHAVKVVATEAATYFFDPTSVGKGQEDGGKSMSSAPSKRDPSLVILDADEWPGREAGDWYERGDSVLHIELRKWADVFVIAPLDANTLAKLAVGLCDNCLTCVWRAWDMAKPVVLAPAMNTLMWQHPFTRRHLKAIAADSGAAHIPGHLDDVQLIAQINDRSRTLRIVPPIVKQLACGDVGTGGLADVAEIVAVVNDVLIRTAAA
ncbi:MAG TPA: flavoprotein [Gemmata sp.]|jgi:phosphopantothenoylcysteine decarboxylase|nr:flavoprotein [Gemmata sp.]